MKAVLFDLDDTLYPECEFVASGFRTVARYLSARARFDEEELVRQMLAILHREGRGHVFDRLLDHIGLNGSVSVMTLVYLYRSHQPLLHLYDDVLPTLKQLRGFGMRLGLLTDGQTCVQRNKIAALDLADLFDVIICTDELGRDCWKLSSVSYQVALQLLDVSPGQAIYIGDDASKDFVAPYALGMMTAQIIRSDRPQRQESPASADGAHWVITRLEQLTSILGVPANVFE